MFKRAFGKRLRTLRRLNGYTQEQLAAHLSITPEHLSNIERGKATPSFKLIENISQAFGTEPANLFMFFTPHRENSPDDAAPLNNSPLDYSFYITDVGFWEYDVNSDSFYWNDTIYKMFGATRQTFTPTWNNFLEIIPPEDMNVVAGCWSELLAGRSVPPFSFRVHHPDNSIHYLIANVEPICDANNMVVSLRGVTIDYTEQKNLEDALRRLQKTMDGQVQNRTSELHELIAHLADEVTDCKNAVGEATERSERLAVAMEIAQVDLWEYDCATGVIRIDGALVRSLGYELQESTAPLALWESRIYPEDRPAHYTAREAYFSGKMDRYEATFRIIGTDGELRWLRAIGRNANSEASPTVVGTLQNVAAAKQAEMALLQSEQLFRDLVENIREFFWVSEPGQPIAYASPHFESMFQMSLDELKQDPRAFLERVHPQDKPKVEAALQHITTCAPEYDITYRIVLPDEAIRWIHSQALPIRDDSGNTVRIVGVTEDVTTVMTMRRQLEQAKENTDKTTRADSLLLASLSHELHTPLTEMLSLLQLLDQTKLTAKQQKFLNHVRSSGVSMLEKVNDALDIARMESGCMQFVPMEFSLHDLINSVIASFQPWILQNGVGLRSQWDESLPPAFVGHSGRIKQILSSLVGNAIKFTQKGEVVIAAQRDNHANSNALVVSLEITAGRGIPQETLRSLFHKDTPTGRPYRAVQTASGLGMIIAKSLTELMQGTIEVEDTKEAGTTFRIRLPLTSAAGAGATKN